MESKEINYKSKQMESKMNDSKKEPEKMSDNHKKIVSMIGIITFILFLVAVAWIIGKPMVQFVSEPEEFRNWVNSYGFVSWIIFLGMMILQIIVAIIPGGALQVGAGYAFGTIEGALLCIIGSILGSVLVFQFVRYFGIKLVEAFFSIEKIRSLKFLHDERKRNILAFIIFLIPGTPKDLLSYFMGLTEMKLSTWIIISTIARMPAITVSTLCGDALGAKEYTWAIIVFLVTSVISIAGMIFYNRLCQKHEKNGNNK